MFCTCSRNCSIAAFNFSPVAVRAGEADLLHNVFASRLNSWIRKSSLPADIDRLPQQVVGGSEVAGQAVQFLAHVGPARQQRDFLGDPLLRKARRLPQQSLQIVQHARPLRRVAGLAA